MFSLHQPPPPTLIPTLIAVSDVLFCADTAMSDSDVPNHIRGDDMTHLNDSLVSLSLTPRAPAFSLAGGGGGVFSRHGEETGVVVRRGEESALVRALCLSVPEKAYLRRRREGWDLTSGMTRLKVVEEEEGGKMGLTQTTLDRHGFVVRRRREKMRNPFYRGVNTYPPSMVDGTMIHVMRHRRHYHSPRTRYCSETVVEDDLVEGVKGLEVGDASYGVRLMLNPAHWVPATAVVEDGKVDTPRPRRRREDTPFEGGDAGGVVQLSRMLETGLTLTMQTEKGFAEEFKGMPYIL
ncbi:hypothetical protein BC829DRAFT_396663 [Chytridium lagenaria]|nr:hypothetical protein BC829DRAFT_396663 [Chytridium lagenaria]